ncbi:MAG: glycosyltransferase family 1 protein [Planctomycetaceae bacterium]|nr:MAG: glycosyltransferase family 1 protein [Planctomycetaceae bacterium]
MMRIAIDARLVSYVQGGTSRYTLRLVQAMAGLVDRETLLVLEGKHTGESPAWPENVRRAQILTPPHHRMEQITLPIELLLLGADLLHSTDFIPPFRRTCRSVITIHDLAFLRFPQLLTPESSRYYRQVGRAVQSADAVIAVSEATRRDVLDLLKADPAKVTVVYEAASPECVPLPTDEVEASRARLGLPERFALFVGTIEPRKNLPVLLRAYAQVWEEHRLPLVVVGRKGWLYEEVFRTRDSLGLKDEVQFVGSVGGDQLVHYYNCADCLVLPSLYEGFGLPVLEAMACGKPVVVSNVSSLPEIVSDAGLLVEPEDIEGFAAAIGRLLGNPELRDELGKKALARSAQFSWERAARETLDLYHRVLAKR